MLPFGLSGIGIKAAAVGVAVLLVGIWVSVLTVQRNHARAVYATCVEQKKALEAVVERLGQQLEAQNAAVDNLKAESVKRQQAAAKALENARRTAQEARGEVERLSQGVGKGLACEKAVEAVRSGL